MKESIRALIGTAAIVGLFAGPAVFILGEPAEADEVVVETPVTTVTVTAPGETVTLPPEVVTLPPILTTETITLPPLPVATQTIRVPLPRATVTIGPVFVPGPTVTETVTVPGATVTAPANPQPTRTVTVRPNIPERSAVPQPTETVTATATVTEPATGQTATERATVTPAPEVRTRDVPGETRTKTETIVRNVLLGTLGTLLLAGLGLLALFLGYMLGQKDAQRNEDDFLKSLKATIRGERY